MEAPRPAVAACSADCGGGEIDFDVGQKLTKGTHTVRLEGDFALSVTFTGLAPRGRGAPYSGKSVPEPPSSFGKSFCLGNPSCMCMTVFS